MSEIRKQAKALITLEGLITKDRIYTVLSEATDPAKRLYYSIVDDRGQSCIYAESRFEILLAPQVAPTATEILARLEYHPQEFRETTMGELIDESQKEDELVRKTVKLTADLEAARVRILELEVRLQHDISELREAISENRIPNETDKEYYRKIIAEIEETLDKNTKVMKTDTSQLVKADFGPDAGKNVKKTLFED